MSDSDEQIQEVGDSQDAANRVTQWKKDIVAKLGQVKALESVEYLGIYKVPHELAKLDRDAYSPRVVSIGAFHHDKPYLSATREHKWRYMLQLFQQIEDPQDFQKFWEDCTNTIYSLDANVRASYAGKIEYNIDELAEIMLLDGCFILQLLLRYDYHCRNKTLDESDPIFNNAWMIPALRHDLILLENQIPFFILRILYDSIKPVIKPKPPSLAQLALTFVLPSLKSRPDVVVNYLTLNCKHLLHLLHKFYLPYLDSSVKTTIIWTPRFLSIPGNQASNSKLWGFNFCATELSEAGIELENQSEADNLLKITFRNGVIKVPPVFNIDQTTKSLFRNLIVFEQCRLSSSSHITSYAILIKSLIRSPQDIGLLRKKQIINQNWIEDDEYLSLFKSILDGVVVKDFCFGELCDEVNAYGSKFRFGRYMKSLHRTYFSSAWSMASFIAALALFVLTFLQTYYTVKPSRAS